MKAIRVEAPAKINWFLSVDGRRPDGYHELSTVFQALELADTVVLEKKDEPGIRLVTDVDWIPADERNLAVKAARKLFEAHALPGGLEIRLRKNIPSGAGLGGGSADAAAVIYSIDRLYDLQLPPAEKIATAVGLGADVAFFLTGGTALGHGVGEILEPLPDPGRIPLVLVKPAENISTKEIFEALDARPSYEAVPVPEAFFSGRAEDYSGALYNTLALVTEERLPVIRSIREALFENGASGALMTGSGSAVYGIFRTPEDAGTAANTMKTLFPDAWVLETATSPSGIRETASLLY